MVVAMCLLLPVLAMSAQAVPITDFDRSKTYKYYDATGGDDSGWALWTGGAYSVDERSASAFSDSTIVGLGQIGWGAVWTSVNCAESGYYTATMNGWYRGFVIASGGAGARIDFVFEVKDLDTGNVIQADTFAIMETYLYYGYFEENWFEATCWKFYAEATHHYGFTLYVKAITLGIVGIASADAWGVEHAYYNSVEVSPYVYVPPDGGICLLEGTEITMADGSTLPVEKVKEGMAILGYDFETSSLVIEDVTYTGKTKTNRLVNINDGLLVVTRTDHPIYVRNGTWEGWVVDPEALMCGMELFCPLNDDVWTEIHTIGWIQDEGANVYALQSTAPDNYLANGILCDKPKK